MDIILGKDAKTGVPVGLPVRERDGAGTYVIGSPGTGKSTFLETMILQDVKRGCGVCVLDAHGDLLRGVQNRLPPNRLNDVVLLDLMDADFPFALNPYWCRDPANPIEVATTIAAVMQVFERLWGFGTQNSSWGPRMEQFLRNTAIVLAHHGLTMAEAPMLMTNKAVRKALVDRTPNDQVRGFWESFDELRDWIKLDRIESTVNKMDGFLANPLVRTIVGQRKDSVDWQRVMDERKIVLVKLDAQLWDVSSLVGSVIAGRILQAALKREHNRTPFFLYADEYHRFATRDFADLLVETRKFGVATTVAHQFRGQLDEQNRGSTLSAANLVAFRVSGEDGKELAGKFSAKPTEETTTRTVPIRVPTLEPMEHLFRNGHSDLRVIRLFDRWFRLLADDVKQIRRSIGGDYPSHLSGRRHGRFYAAKWTEMEEAQELYGQYLVSTSYRRTDATLLDQVVELLTPWLVLAVEDGGDWASFVESFRADMVELGRLVGEQPILIASGQYEEEEVSRRTYGDVGDQVANELATQPNYRARLRLGTREVDLQLTRPAPIPANRGQAEIRNRSRKLVGRPRSDVELEIWERHQDLKRTEPTTVSPVVESVAAYADALPPPGSRKATN